MADSKNGLLDIFEEFEGGISEHINNAVSKIVEDINESLQTMLRATIDKAECLEESVKKDFNTIKDRLEKFSFVDNKNSNGKDNYTVSSTRVNEKVEKEDINLKAAEILPIDDSLSIKDQKSKHSSSDNSRNVADDEYVQCNNAAITVSYPAIDNIQKSQDANVSTDATKNNDFNEISHADATVAKDLKNNPEMCQKTLSNDVTDMNDNKFIPCSQSRTRDFDEKLNHNIPDNVKDNNQAFENTVQREGDKNSSQFVDGPSLQSLQKIERKKVFEQTETYNEKRDEFKSHLNHNDNDKYLGSTSLNNMSSTYPKDYAAHHLEKVNPLERDVDLQIQRKEKTNANKDDVESHRYAQGNVSTEKETLSTTSFRFETNEKNQDNTVSPQEIHYTNTSSNTFNYSTNPNLSVPSIYENTRPRGQSTERLEIDKYKVAHDSNKRDEKDKNTVETSQTSHLSSTLDKNPINGHMINQPESDQPSFKFQYRNDQELNRPYEMTENHTNEIDFQQAIDNNLLGKDDDVNPYGSEIVNSHSSEMPSHSMNKQGLEEETDNNAISTYRSLGQLENEKRKVPNKSEVDQTYRYDERGFQNNNYSQKVHDEYKDARSFSMAPTSTNDFTQLSSIREQGFNDTTSNQKHTFEPINQNLAFQQPPNATDSHVDRLENKVNDITNRSFECFENKKKNDDTGDIPSLVAPIKERSMENLFNNQLEDIPHYKNNVEDKNSDKNHRMYPDNEVLSSAFDGHEKKRKLYPSDLTVETTSNTSDPHLDSFEMPFKKERTDQSSYMPNYPAVVTNDFNLSKSTSEDLLREYNPITQSNNVSIQGALNEEKLNGSDDTAFPSEMENDQGTADGEEESTSSFIETIKRKLSRYDTEYVKPLEQENNSSWSTNNETEQTQTISEKDGEDKKNRAFEMSQDIYKSYISESGRKPSVVYDMQTESEVSYNEASKDTVSESFQPRKTNDHSDSFRMTQDRFNHIWPMEEPPLVSNAIQSNSFSNQDPINDNISMQNAPNSYESRYNDIPGAQLQNSEMLGDNKRMSINDNVPFQTDSYSYGFRYNDAPSTQMRNSETLDSNKRMPINDDVPFQNTSNSYNSGFSDVPGAQIRNTEMLDDNKRIPINDNVSFQNTSNLYNPSYNDVPGVHMRNIEMSDDSKRMSINDNVSFQNTSNSYNSSYNDVPGAHMRNTEMLDDKKRMPINDNVSFQNTSNSYNSSYIDVPGAHMQNTEVLDENKRIPINDNTSFQNALNSYESSYNDIPGTQTRNPEILDDNKRIPMNDNLPFQNTSNSYNSRFNDLPSAQMRIAEMLEDYKSIPQPQNMDYLNNNPSGYEVSPFRRQDNIQYPDNDSYRERPDYLVTNPSQNAQTNMNESKGSSLLSKLQRIASNYDQDRFAPQNNPPPPSFPVNNNESQSNFSSYPSSQGFGSFTPGTFPPPSNVSVPPQENNFILPPRVSNPWTSGENQNKLNLNDSAKNIQNHLQSVINNNVKNDFLSNLKKRISMQDREYQFSKGQGLPSSNPSFGGQMNSSQKERNQPSKLTMNNIKGGNENIRCNECNISFFSKDFLERHVQIMHQKMKSYK